MWNRDFLKKLIDSLAKNYGMAIADSVSVESLNNPSSTAVGGLASATLDTWKDMKEHIKDCNEARYFLFVQTFLETAEIDQEQFNKFIEENPDNVKFGLEVLKLLEEVTIEEQAKMLSKNLSLRANKKIDDNEYNQNIFIIMRFDKYLIDQFKKYMVYEKPIQGMTFVWGDNNLSNLNQVEIPDMFYHPPMDFVSFGFLIQEVPKEMKIISNVTGIQRNSHYSITTTAEKFYKTFFKETNVQNNQSYNYRYW